MERVTKQKATPASFAAYGSVVTIPSGRTTSESPEYKFWSDIAHYHIDGETEIGVCTVYESQQQVLTGIERHLRTPEILIPIDGPFILPLAREINGKIVVDAFTVAVGEAVVINPGVWHGPCLPVGQPSESYYVIFRRGTPAEDVEKRTIPAAEIS